MDTKALNKRVGSAGVQYAQKLLEYYEKLIEAGRKLYFQPLYAYRNLAGTVDDQGQLSESELTYYNQAVGAQNAYGFGQPLTRAETNLATASIFDANASYVAVAMGVDVQEDNPLPVARAVMRQSFVSQDRGSSNVWRAGATRFWPCGQLGLQTRAIVDNQPGAVETFARNGSRDMVVFPAGGEIEMPPVNQIAFNLGFGQRPFITLDGQPLNPDQTNRVDEALVGIVFYGVKIEAIQA